MDPRVERQAEILVDHSVEVEAGDNVLISGAPVAEDLVVTVFELLGERGAHPFWVGSSDRADRAYRRAVEVDAMDLHEHELAAIEETDVHISIRASRNTKETGDVPTAKNRRYRQVNQPILEERLSKRWALTQFPTTGNAQAAEMSLAAYEDFVWSAINKDWDAQREFQAQLVDLLEDASEIRVVSGESTDLSMSIEGMVPVNDYGERNMPGGEVFTAPVPDSVEGTVHFDMPLIAEGREVADVKLEFADGEVVGHEAGENEEVLASVLETDPGARRLGELGIGMNRDIDRFTYNMLFDEKMGDTVHMALGRAYEMNVGPGRERNESAVHMDMIVDMSEDSHIAVDDEIIQENGTFRFE